MHGFDYIIAGAGSAGCVLANRLSADPGVTVLLLEAGGSDRSPVFSIPKGSGLVFENEKYTWQYTTTPFGSNPHTERWMRGKVMGGSSSINGIGTTSCRSSPPSRTTNSDPHLPADRVARCTSPPRRIPTRCAKR